VNIQSIDELLAHHPFFAGLDPKDLLFMRVAGCGRNVHFPEGMYILREGEPADRFYIVREGRVALEIAAPSRGPIVLDTLGGGAVVGASWLFPPYRWRFDVRAVEPTSAVALDAVCLREKCEEDPRLGYELMKRMSGVLEERLQSARMRLIDLYSHAGTG